MALVTRHLLLFSALVVGLQSVEEIVRPSRLILVLKLRHSLDQRSKFFL